MINQLVAPGSVTVAGAFDSAPTLPRYARNECAYNCFITFSYVYKKLSLRSSFTATERWEILLVVLLVICIQSSVSHDRANFPSAFVCVDSGLTGGIYLLHVT